MMKKLFLLLTLSVSCAAWAQPFREKMGLLDLRASLHAEDSLMRLGILKDDATGLPYFTGYSYNVLYDWDQYFEAIVQIYRHSYSCSRNTIICL